MASTDVLSQTLSSITAIKLDQLQEQKDAYETKKSSLIEDANSEVERTKRIRKLLKGAEDLRSFGLRQPFSLPGLQECLDQAEYDPSVSDQLLQEYEELLRGHLSAQTNKYKFASLYGKLVEEWIASGTPETASSADGPPTAPVGREEMHQQRSTWEEYAFKAKETDAKAIRAYLDDVFASKDARRALETLRETLKTYQKEWKTKQHFDEDTLETCITGMLRSDILTEEKRTTLRDFLGNEVVLSEIADVLNTRMSAMATWTWGSPLIVEQRRNLNGRYRFYTDEDLLHSIFVYYIGLRWATQLREVLQKFIRAEGVWKLDEQPYSKSEYRRRRYFLGDRIKPTHSHHMSVMRRREDHFHGILLDQLPESFNEVRGSYGDDDDKEGDTKASHVRVVQELLQHIQTDILLQSKLGSGITVIRSDFKWFGPSLPHSTIFAVLDFFGIDAEWMDFFKRVLEATIRFKQDSPDTPSQVRKRGIPVSTPLTDVMGESMLFCLDYAVNQKAAGNRLYRLHDDMWLWGDSEKCAAAWKVVTEFTNTMGLELNQDKTGSVRITKDSSTTVPSAQPGLLPDGDVTWGFLKLDPATGRFLIDQQEVDKHIDELRLQLSACRTVLDYIQAWNIYGNRFFSTNFGQPANCYGQAHLDSMLATFRRIQDKLFPDHSGGVGEHVKRMIVSRLGLDPSDVPDGCLYWPASMGGLGLQNPFVSALLVRSQVAENPEKFIDKFLEDEEFEYRRAKARFEKGMGGSDTATHDDRSSVSGSSEVHDRRDEREFKDLQNEPFMSFDEFKRHRERVSSRYGQTYGELMTVPTTKEVVTRSDIQPTPIEEGIWDKLTWSERWMVYQHHKDMISRFRGLDAFDQGLLPTGLMAMLRESRFRWQG